MLGAIHSTEVMRFLSDISDSTLGTTFQHSSYHYCDMMDRNILTTKCRRISPR